MSTLYAPAEAIWARVICPMCKGRGCDYCTKGRM